MLHVTESMKSIVKSLLIIVREVSISLATDETILSLKKSALVCRVFFAQSLSHVLSWMATDSCKFKSVLSPSP